VCAFAGCGYVNGRPADGNEADRFVDARTDAEGLIDLAPEIVAAAALGHPKQIYMLAVALWTASRPVLARKWFSRAAALREVNSLLLLGDIFRNGWALSAPDLVEARRLYEEGAELGHAPAMARLGAMLARGEGGEADEQRGVALVREATKQGHKPAWAALADLIEAGLAPSRNPERDIAAYRERAA
jgi:TPR repeat protein